MRVLSFPLRLDGSGGFATVEQGSARHAAEIAQVAASVRHGERPLSPLYGSMAPEGGMSLAMVAAGIEASEPGLVVREIDQDITANGSASLRLAVHWEG